MTIYHVDIDALTGGPAGPDQLRNPVTLVVNAASTCEVTPPGQPAVGAEKPLPR